MYKAAPARLLEDERLDTRYWDRDLLLTELGIEELFEILGRDSSVGIASRYRLDGPGIEFRWGRDFQHPS